MGSQRMILRAGEGNAEWMLRLCQKVFAGLFAPSQIRDAAPFSSRVPPPLFSSALLLRLCRCRRVWVHQVWMGIYTSVRVHVCSDILKTNVAVKRKLWCVCVCVWLLPLALWGDSVLAATAHQSTLSCLGRRQDLSLSPSIIPPYPPSSALSSYFWQGRRLPLAVSLSIFTVHFPRWRCGGEQQPVEEAELH